MIIEIDGVSVQVPDRYPGYSDLVKTCIEYRVRDMQTMCRGSLSSVHVDRVTEQNTTHPKVHGSYTTVIV